MVYEIAFIFVRHEAILSNDWLFVSRNHQMMLPIIQWVNYVNLKQASILGSYFNEIIESNLKVDICVKPGDIFK